MSTIDDRRKINRENARKSTGPKTPEGKKRSAMNATRHGITGQVIALLEKDMEAYVSLTKAIRESFDPVGPYKIQLAHKIADSEWRSNHSRSQQDLLTCRAAFEGLDLYSDHNEPQASAAFAMAAAGRPASKPYNPQNDGFVFSIVAIKAFIHRENRIQAARDLPEVACHAA